MGALVFEGLEENFKFAVLEVTKQVEDTLLALDNPEPGIIDRIKNRDDYVDNLKSIIENRGFSHVIGDGNTDKREVDFLRTFLTITNNLEKIGDYAVNIVGQLQHLTDRRFLENYDYRQFFEEAIGALRLIVTALYKQDTQLALRICQAELNLDVLYRRTFDQIMKALRSGANPENLITSLFVFQYLERMGDALQNVGEAIIFSIMGEKIKIREYQVLEGSLARTGFKEKSLGKLQYNGIWGTRSGCRIGSVGEKGRGGREKNVIFKHGQIKKLLREKENLEKWEEISPGLPPKIFAFQRDKEAAALLLEFLEGENLQEITLNGRDEYFQKAFSRFQKTVVELWEKTMIPKETPIDFVSQIDSRLEEVYRLHPYFKYPNKLIGWEFVPSLQNLLNDVRPIENSLRGAFTVFIHGDFNINNIVYNQFEDKIHYIDLHRSAEADYVQDVSVFLISNFRLPVFDSKSRQRLNDAILAFYKTCLDFSEKYSDPTFQPRLALGLARSFLSSTRFEFRRKFAQNMLLRGEYLLRKILQHSAGSLNGFRLPEEVLLY
jgi:phosphate uptake regulator